MSGTDQSDDFGARNEQALAVLEAGDSERASILFDSLLADRLRVLGPDHPDVLATRGHLARAVMEAGDPGRAVDLFGLVSGESVRLLGAHHPDTLIARAPKIGRASCRERV